MTFEEARAQFPVLEHTAYLNAGTFGPLSRATAAAVAEWQARDLEHGRGGGTYFEEILAVREVVRERIGALVGVGPEHVSLTASTTDGCGIVLAGLGLGPDDEVVTTSEEHFGLLGALHASDARVVVAEPAPEAILAAVTPRTRLLALSQVLWTTGRELPLAELKAESGLPLLNDGAQSVGAIPVDGSAFDFLTISGQKWLCGPDSTGALVVADPERLRVARPSYLSKVDYEPDGRFTAKPGAARFDPNWRLPQRRSRACSRRSTARRSGATRAPLPRRAGSACCSPARPRSSREAARSSPSAPTATPARPSRASTRPASSSARSRTRASSALRAAGGRATAT